VDERTPWAKRRSEQRRWDAALCYQLEMESRMVGWGDPALVYDEEKDLYRFTDGRFAFSRNHADWALLRKRVDEEVSKPLPSIEDLRLLRTDILLAIGAHRVTWVGRVHVVTWPAVQVVAIITV
jgi:hypothetical protein